MGLGDCVDYGKDFYGEEVDPWTSRERAKQKRATEGKVVVVGGQEERRIGARVAVVDGLDLTGSRTREEGYVRGRGSIDRYSISACTSDVLYVE